MEFFPEIYTRKWPHLHIKQTSEIIPNYVRQHERIIARFARRFLMHILRIKNKCRIIHNFFHKQPATDMHLKPQGHTQRTNNRNQNLVLAYWLTSPQVAQGIPQALTPWGMGRLPPPWPNLLCR